MRRGAILLPLLCFSAAAPAQEAPLAADQAAIEAHVAFLASDVLKGREAGSVEYDIAAGYVAAQFRAAGLRPGGDAGGYLQHVPLVSYRVTGKRSAKLGGRSFRFGVDYVPIANPAAARTRLSGPIVAVGQGIVAPAYGRDDYAGKDVRGSIVAFSAGAPENMTGEERAYLGSIATKADLAAARGAIGAVVLADGTAFAAARRDDRARTTWANPDGTGHPASSIPVLATIGPIGAAKLAKGGTLTIDTTTAFAPSRSSNVIGVIPGSDPRLGREVVVLSAHLDHIGVGAPDATGDTINNGALDDAIGIASLIEEAKCFTAGKPPRRTVLFLAVTAEEKGLIGSDWFVHHPSPPLDSASPNRSGTSPLLHPTSQSVYSVGGRVGERAGAASAQADQIIVADVNLDMPILTYRFEDMVAFGGDRSTLGPVIRRALGAIGVDLSPDWIPEQGIFVRSDHFNFVRQGVPSVFLWPGPKGAGKGVTEAFLATRYHRPSDDLTQPILWDQAVRFVDANYRIAREIADADARPVWNKGDYFGTLFNGPMAE